MPHSAERKIARRVFWFFRTCWTGWTRSSENPAGSTLENDLRTEGVAIPGIILYGNCHGKKFAPGYQPKEILPDSVSGPIKKVGVGVRISSRTACLSW